jgi:epoxyqueuosine reductase QueG
MSASEDLDLQQATDQLKAFAMKNGAMVCGVADAQAFTEAPEGFRPGDLLPRAQRVVVVGGNPPRAGDWASPLVELQETMGTSDRINSLGLRVAKFIEDHFGYYALFVPPGVNKGNRPFLSVMLAAELAGCGSRSLAGPILHPQYGMLFYAAIITTLPFVSDAPLDPPACPAPSCLDMWNEQATTPCLQVCPIEHDGCLGGSIADGRIASRHYDRARCTSRVHTYWIPGFQKALQAALDEDDKERRKMILYSSFFTRTLWSMTYAAQSQGQCYECMRVCPVGLEYRTKK